MTDELHKNHEKELKDHWDEIKKKEARVRPCKPNEVRLVSEAEVRAYAPQFLNGQVGWLITTCRCESGLNAQAVSPDGRFLGLCQFYPSTFAHFGGSSGTIFDWREQVKVVGTMIKTLGFERARRHWPWCGML